MQEYEDAKALTEMWRLLKDSKYENHYFENLQIKHSNDQSQGKQKPLLKSQDEALTKDRRMVRV